MEKLRRLEAAGADQWNICLMASGQDETIEAYGRNVIPAFTVDAGLAAARSTE